MGSIAKEMLKGVYAPLNGKVVSLDEVPDPVFSGRVLGEGCAIIPTDGKIYSPVNGEVSSVAETLHAYGFTSEDDLEVLIHFGLETVGLRYFNVFGRRQDPHGAYAAVIPKFLKQLLNDEVPTINGDGKQSRDFTYIDNVIEANLKACLASSEAAGNAFNVAYGGREYLIDIYYHLCDALGKKVEPKFGPDRAGDIKHSNADISKARNLLGYDPDYDFKKGIALAIEWYKEYL